MLFIENLSTFLYYIVFPNSKVIVFEDNNDIEEIMCNCNLCYTVRNILNFFMRKLKIV